MSSKKLVEEWFHCWNTGNYSELPITDGFSHTSPFGTIEGKSAYIKLIKKNEEKFLGYSFEIHDGLYGDHHACVRYTGSQGDFSLDVSEWYYFKNDKIDRIVAYYHIGEIREERQLR